MKGARRGDCLADEDNDTVLANMPVRPGASGLKNVCPRLAALGGEARFEPRPGGGPA